LGYHFLTNLKGKGFIAKLSPIFWGESREILCVRKKDIKSKPSVTKSLPHQAPFAPQEELGKSCCASTPGKTPGTAAMRAPPPPYARGYWHCNRRCAAASQ
jgi:hypothetical protein